MLLVVIAATPALARSNPASGGASVSGNPAPAIAAYAYVGTNISGYGVGTVNNYIISNAGISLSANGSSVSGASGLLALTGQYVFATDGKYIVTYTRDNNGGLRQTSSVDGTAHNITPQGSIVGPLTVDRSGQTLYAAEIEFDGTDNDAYSAWTINSDGSLTFLANSNVNVNYNTPLSFTQDDRYAYGWGCYFLGWEITGLKRNDDGSLNGFETNGLAPPSNDFLCPSDATASGLGFVAVPFIDVEIQGAPEQLATYTINSDGSLSLLEHSVLTTPFAGEHSSVFDPSGQYLAMAGDAGIQMYQLESGIPVPVGSVVDGNTTFSTLRWDNSNHVYAISGSGLYVFTANAGMLTQNPGSPLPIDQAASLAVLPAQ